VLVDRDGDDVVVRDLWYPYAPGTDVLVQMRVSDDPWDAFHEDAYVGTTACAACHVAEHESWLVTHHAIAWRTLVEHEATDDATCVGCHVTGYGEPTGWSGDPTSILVDVGCEACHGPGGPHDGKATEPASTCAGCHDAKHSIAFSYEKGLPLLDHFATVELDGDAVRDRRRALLRGDVDQALLAFGDGAWVGAEACTSCHEAVHDAWQQGPHAGAMRTLEEGEAQDDPACVRCHATRTRGGPPSTDLADYRREEGVGCEACHGPGGAHVAAEGGTGNIVGLGDSCPVCVIEAVCTRCHTPQWDADWNLEAALPRARHDLPAPDEPGE
jgi:hypothetical protein